MKNMGAGSIIAGLSVILLFAVYIITSIPNIPGILKAAMTMLLIGVLVLVAGILKEKEKEKGKEEDEGDISKY